MFLKVYYEDSRVCGPRSIGFLDVKGCLKFFGAVLERFFAWEKSMLLSSGFLSVAKPDEWLSKLDVVYGVNNLD